MQINVETLSAWKLVTQSDLLSKFILFSLFAVSVICIAIILFKIYFFWKEKKVMRELVEKLKRIQKTSDLLNLNLSEHNSFASYFLSNSLNNYKQLKAEHNILSKEVVEELEIDMNRVMDEIIILGEEYLPFLGTSAAVAPLIGLFGTVWGLIHAFINISQEKSADIIVVAPGIAEALTTTLAGLIVAIPAMIFFHYFSNELRKIEQQMLSCSDRVMNIICKNF